jgi:hypothetical protein
MSEETTYNAQVRSIYNLLLVLFTLFVISGGSLIYYVNNPDAFNFSKTSDKLVTAPIEDDSDRIENGIHVRTGLVEADGLMTVVNNCTNCHSAKLVTQNRMNSESWNTTIKWMQETQNLWDLGGNQEIIVNYLVTNYPPKAKGRRMVLTDIDWYELED